MYKLSNVKIGPSDYVDDGYGNKYGFGLSVSMDGKEISGVRSAVVKFGDQEFPVVTLELNANVEVEGLENAQVKEKNESINISLNAVDAEAVKQALNKINGQGYKLTKAIGKWGRP